MTNEKVALVTGASSGFGRLTALQLAAEGYRVIAGMRDPNKKALLMEEAKERRIDSLIACWKLDVNRAEDIAHTAAELRNRYGRLDLLVNNAGFAAGGAVEEVPLEAWRAQMETNFFAVIALTQALLPLMRERQHGFIFNISSISGRIGIPGYGPYCASKFALEGLSEALRFELKPHGIHVVLIEPGAYRTQIWDKGFARIHSSEQSPYHKQMEAVLHYSRKSAEAASDPEQVAQAIVRITKLAKPGFRYPLGPGVKTAILGKQLLPWRWFERIMTKMLKPSS